MYTLFDTIDKKTENSTPLAERMRPLTLKEFLGQSEIASDGSLLKRAIISDKLGSCIFFGPPGTGKTTLANIIANSTAGNFVKLNAVTSGVSDVKKAIEKAEDDLKLFGKRTYLLLDECHRFNKTQQDSLLPAIENGTIIFIGSTTENPYVAMTPAIISRCRVFEFKSLSTEIIKNALKKAVALLYGSYTCFFVIVCYNADYGVVLNIGVACVELVVFVWLVKIKACGIFTVAHLF